MHAPHNIYNHQEGELLMRIKTLHINKGNMESSESKFGFVYVLNHYNK